MAYNDTLNQAGSGNVKLENLSLSNTDNSVVNMGLQGSDLKAVGAVIETALNTASAGMSAQSAQMQSELTKKQINASSLNNALKYALCGIVAFLLFKIFKGKK